MHQCDFEEVNWNPAASCLLARIIKMQVMIGLPQAQGLLAKMLN